MMSLQWMAVASFLYFEIALAVLFMLPIISSARWQKIFRSRILTSFRSYANIYFNIFIVILVLLFVDSIRDVKKYTEASSETPDLSNNPMAESMNNMKLFRAQRNFYIAGFALFLFVILRKLVTMISEQAHLEAEGQAARKQAESATATAKALLEQGDEGKASGGDNTELQDQLNESKVKITDLRNELEATKSNLAAMKKQAEATNREYDRLLEEHAKLNKQLEAAKGDEGSKKDD